MSERIKPDDDIAELWRSGHLRRTADLGAWLRKYLRERRLRTLQTKASYPKAASYPKEASYPKGNPALIKKAAV